MEKKFIKTRCVKDIIIFVSLVAIGAVLSFLPVGIEINLLGYTAVVTGVILSFVLKNGYKEINSGERYQRVEYSFQQNMKSKILSALENEPNSIDLSKEGDSQSLRLDIYYNVKSNIAHIQLFEYIPYKYEPYSNIYDYEIKKVDKLIKK